MAKREYRIKYRDFQSGIIADDVDIYSGGRRLVMNFERSRKSLYAAAVRRYNREHHAKILTIRTDAPYCADGKTVRQWKGSCSLWETPGKGNLADFWRIEAELRGMGADDAHN